MTGKKTRKVLELNENGTHLMCIRTDDKINPYRVYKKSIGHCNLLIKYGDLMSVIHFLRDFYLNALDTMPLGEIKAWIAEHSA